MCMCARACTRSQVIVLRALYNAPEGTIFVPCGGQRKQNKAFIEKNTRQNEI